MNKDETVDKLHADRDRVLNAIATAPDVSNSLILYRLVQTLIRSTCHIVATAEKENRHLTPYEQGRMDGWVATLKSIAKDLDTFTTGLQ